MSDENSASSNEMQQARPGSFHPPADKTSDNEGLCESCSALNISPRSFVVVPGDDDGPGEWLPFGTLKTTADKKAHCPLCRLVFDAVNGDKLLSQEGAKGGLTVTYRWDTKKLAGQSFDQVLGAKLKGTAPYSGVRRIRLSVVDDHNKRPDSMPHWTSIGLHLLRDDLPKTVTVGTGSSARVFEQQPGAGDSLAVRRQDDRIDLKLARQWIETCKTQHTETCGKYTVSTTRFLYDDQNIDTVYLRRKRQKFKKESIHPMDVLPRCLCIDVAGRCLGWMHEETRYAALSYVWGHQKFFQTTKDNVDRMCLKGSLNKLGDDLPATIRDAMYIAGKLKIQYLWVDTLCIIQDDEEAKAEAISAMGLIYCAAEVVFVAAASHNASDGIVGLYPDVAGHNSGIRRPPQRIEQIGQNPGFRLTHMTYPAAPKTQQQIGASYGERGWTMQEMHFATRRLIFGDRGMMRFGCKFGYKLEEADWELCDTVWDEEFTEPLVDYETVKFAYQTGKDKELDGMGYHISQYTKRHLTFRSDIYNAFAGFARELQAVYNTDMCHGIPTLFFDWFLMWQPHRPSSNTAGAIGNIVNTADTISIPTRQAPSWSWASWTGERADLMHLFTARMKASEVNEYIRNRTWIVWYHRKSHDSTECLPLNRYHRPSRGGLGSLFSSRSDYNGRNLYGAVPDLRPRFLEIDCTESKPTPLIMFNPSSTPGTSPGGTKHSSTPPSDAWPPTYVPDILSNTPGSGFLQFWTLSVQFLVTEHIFDKPLEATSTPTDPDAPYPNTFVQVNQPGTADARWHLPSRRLDMTGRNGVYVGRIFVPHDWLHRQRAQKGLLGTKGKGMPLSMECEFIIICEATSGNEGWGYSWGDGQGVLKYSVMMIEWVSPGYTRSPTGSIRPKSVPGSTNTNMASAYAERVAVGWIEDGSPDEALNRPEWKEIILG